MAHDQRRTPPGVSDRAGRCFSDSHARDHYGSPGLDDAGSARSPDPGGVAEGLSAAEAHKELQHHEHAPQLRGRHGRTLQIAEAVVLAMVTLIAGWSGFSAAKFSTESRLLLGQAGAARTEAAHDDGTALQLRNYDASTFNAWFTAWTVGDGIKMRVAERRFRPAYKVAFDAWWATHPATNANSPPGPAFMPQYVIPEEAQAKALDARADHLTAEAQTAGRYGDDYVRVTAVLAGVLFLVGIGSTFSLVGVRYALLGVGFALLVLAGVLLLSLPRPPA